MLTSDDCTRIAQLIVSFRGPIKWDDIIKLAEEVTGRLYCRQWLEKRNVIRSAYEQVRSRSEGENVDSAKQKPNEIVALEDRIVRLEAENRRLEVLDAQNREKFIIWAENARKRGFTERELSTPLQKIDRGATPERGDSDGKRDKRQGGKGAGSGQSGEVAGKPGRNPSARRPAE